MATERLDITVRLNDASKAGTRAVKKNISGIGVAAGQASKSIKALGASLLGITAIFAAGRGFAAALNTFKEFDDAMRQVGAVTNATAQEFENLNDVAKELGKSTRFTATQAAEGLKFLGLAGFEAAEAIGAIPDVLNLAAAGSLELGQAADITTNILAGFGLEVEQLSGVNDVLVKTFTSSNNNLVELGEAFKLVGPIAKGVGADFEDLLATIGKLGDAGLKASIGGTTLRGTLAALFNPTKQEAKLMEELSERIGGTGLQIKNAEGNFIGFVDVIKQLEQAGLRGEEALKLFGLRAGPGVAALLNQGSVALEELRDGLRDAGGVADEIAEKMEAGIGGASRRLAAALEGLQIAFIDTFGGEVSESIETLTDSINNLSGAIENSTEELNFFADIAGKLLTIVSNSVRAVGTNLLNVVRSVKIAGLSMIGQFNQVDIEINKIIDSYKDLIEEVGKDLGIIEIPVEVRVDKALDDFFSSLDNAAGPIGRGAEKVGDEVAKNIIQPASIESRLKSAFIRLRAELDKESAKIESEYKRGIIDLDQYFEEREVIVRTQLAKEVELLRQKLKTESDLSKKEIIRATISAKETQLQKELIELEKEKFQEFTKLEKARNQELDQRIIKQKALEQQQVQADKILNDIKFRNAQSLSTALEALQANELAKLDQRQQEELARFTKFVQDQVDAEQQIKDLAREQELEKDKVLASQQKRLFEFRLQFAADVFDGLAQISNDLFELSGRQSKELFAIAQASAIATAIMNTAVGVTKALAQGGIFGIITGAIVAAAGAVQIATIASQSFADGGIIQGHSPHSRADNIPINATAGEGVVNVPGMQRIGPDALNLINKQAPMDQIISAMSNKGKMANFSIPKASSGRLSFADGGQIPRQVQPSFAGTGTGAVQPFNIINVPDSSFITQYLSTNEGKNAVINVIGAKAKVVRNKLGI